MRIDRPLNKLILLLTLLLSSCTSLLLPNVETEVASLRAGDYSLDRAHAALLFKVQHLGLSTYVGRFNDFSASLDFDPQNVAASKLDSIIEIDSLDINDSFLTEDLLTATWFDASIYPQAIFTTKTVKPISENEFEFIGNLTWRGVTKETSVLGTFHGGGFNVLTGKYTLGFSAQATIMRSDFGMDAYIPIVGDRVDLEIFVEFQKN